MRAGVEAARVANETLETARELGGTPRVSFDISPGRPLRVSAEVVLTAEQAAVVAGRLEKLRELEGTYQ